MGSFSLWHWAIVIIAVVLLFGRGKMSEMMGDFAKGIKSFKKGLADDDTPPSQIAATPPTAAAPVQQPTHSDTPRA